MKILIVTNLYRSGAPSGENAAVAVEVAALRRAGHEVYEYVTRSDAIRSDRLIDKILLSFAVIWNHSIGRDLRRRIIELCVDVVHFHNVFPVISLGSLYYIPKTVGVVYTLHNYRNLCPKAVPLRSGISCDLCFSTRVKLFSLRYRCYRGGFMATLPLFMASLFHGLLGTINRRVDVLVSLTEFQRRLHSESGIHGKFHVVKCNSVPDASVGGFVKGARCVFVGRLSEEKGVGVLLKAWALLGSDAPELLIVGSGPLESELRALSVPSVKFAGLVSEQEAFRLIAESRLLIVPSLWFEGYPLVVRDALVAGTAFLCSDIGSLGELARESGAGKLFAVGDAVELAEGVRATFSDVEWCTAAGDQGRRFAEGSIFERANMANLQAFYETACAVANGRS